MLRSQMNQKEQLAVTEGLKRERPQYGAVREVEIDAIPTSDIVASERRFRRNTYLVVALLVIGGLIFSGWRMALGVALGGALSVFNERWLRSSVGAILGAAGTTRNQRMPRWTATKFILR